MSFNVLKIDVRDLIQLTNHSQSPQDFLLDLVSLLVIELLKIVLLEIEFTLVTHEAKIQKVVQLDNSTFFLRMKHNG